MSHSDEIISLPETPSPPLPELLHFYEIRMAALSGYAELTWNRFNWSLTLHIAMLGFYFTLKPTATSDPLLAYGVPTIGIFIALAWFLIGWADFQSLDRHRRRTTALNREIVPLLRIEKLDGFGTPAETNDQYFAPVRQTHTLFWLPVLAAVLWTALLVRIAIV